MVPLKIFTISFIYPSLPRQESERYMAFFLTGYGQLQVNDVDQANRRTIEDGNPLNVSRN